MNEQLLNIFITVLTIVIPALAVVGVRYLNSYVDNKLGAIDSETNNNYAELQKKYLDMGRNMLVDVMKAIEQTLVLELKKASSDGKLTKEDGIKVKDEVIKVFLENVSQDIIITIEELYGDVNGFLDIIIEAKVRDVSTNK